MFKLNLSYVLHCLLRRKAFQVFLQLVMIEEIFVYFVGKTDESQGKLEGKAPRTNIHQVMNPQFKKNILSSMKEQKRKSSRKV